MKVVKPRTILPANVQATNLSRLNPLWSSSASYVVGDKVDLTTDPYTYECIQNNTNNDPITATTFWRKVGYNNLYAAFDQQVSTVSVSENNPSSFQPPSSVTGDAFFSNVSLLFHGEGTNGGTVITDSSSFNHVFSNIGSVTTSTSQFRFGASSLSFNGSAYLSIANSAPFQFEGGDYTIECFVRPTDLSTSRIVYAANDILTGNFGFMVIRITQTGALQVSIQPTTGVPGTSASVTSASGLITVNTWSHIAVSRIGTTILLFVNGNLVQSGNTWLTHPANNFTTIGIGGYGNGYTDASQLRFVGNIDEFRITKGLARYNASFTVPTAAFPDVSSGVITPTVNTVTNTITYTLSLVDLYDSVSLFNIKGKSVRVQVTAPGVTYDTGVRALDDALITDWYDYFFSEIVEKSELVFTDIPPVLGSSTLSITIESRDNTVAQVGAIVIGSQFYIGTTDYGTSVGIIDFSRKETDEFGNTTFVQRAFSKRISAPVTVAKDNVKKTQRVLSDLRATPCVWIGAEDETYGSTLTTYGFYRDFSLAIEYPSHSLCELEIEGLT